MKKTLSSARKPQRYLLERGRPLSQSLLWRLQRAYYGQQGIDAWRQGAVPQYITSNTFMANVCARVVSAFLQDCLGVGGAARQDAPAQVDSRQPVYLIELGAGSGRFAYHFLKRFPDLLAQAGLAELPFCYVMTDFARQTVEFWRSHPAFEPFVAAGQLDFALFDAGQPSELVLLHSGEVLLKKGTYNPLVVIANYVFDSLPQDLFTVRGGRLYENRVTLASPQPEENRGDPSLLGRLEITHRPKRVTPDYYHEPEFNRILGSFVGRLSQATFTFPCVALRCIRFFLDLCGERMLLLSADKSYASESELVSDDTPWLSLHGSISMVVNYPALREWVLNDGGIVLQPARRPAHLLISACLFGSHPSGNPQTRLAFDQAVENGGPDDFYTRKEEIVHRIESLPLEELLAWLSWSGWDAGVLWDCIPALLPKVRFAAGEVKEELRRAIHKVWDHYFPIGEPRDLAFHLGTLLQAMKFYQDALESYEASLQQYVLTLGTLYNSGVCCYHLHQLHAALGWFERVLEISPGFEAAAAMRQKILAEMDRQE